VPALAAKLAEVEAERDAKVEEERAFWVKQSNALVDQVEAAEATIAHLEAHIEGTARDTHKLLVDAEARVAELEALLAADRKAHTKEIAVWSENYTALERAANQAEMIASLRQANEEMAGKLEGVEKLVEALSWYREQSRLCRLIHSEGDAGRHALSDDGGKRAAAALAAWEDTKEGREKERPCPYPGAYERGECCGGYCTMKEADGDTP
jgi:septal ring factor EnvC (AmiA/AmiB activator)